MGSLGHRIVLDELVDLRFCSPTVDQVLKLEIDILVLDNLGGFLGGELGGIGCRFSKVFRVDVLPGFLCCGCRRDAGEIGSCDLIKRRVDLCLGRGLVGFLGKVDVRTGGSKCLFCQRLGDRLGHLLDDDFLDGLFRFAGDVGDRQKGVGITDNDIELPCGDTG